MLAQAAVAFLNEPSPPRPAGIPWWDVAVAVVLLPLGVWEALIQSSLPWRPAAVALALLSPFVFVVRRPYPLAAVLIGITPRLVVDVTAFAVDVPWKDGASGIVVLLLAYTLFRWGAGRDAGIGLLLIVVLYAATAFTGEIQTVPEAIAAAVVLLFAPTLGAAFRFRASAHRRALDETRLRERERLARELHDTVAHYVSAIAIQAQAGRAVAATRPAAAADALSIIEEAASKTLSELRTIVAALRDDEAASLTAQHGLADLDDLESAAGHKLAVHVSRLGDLEDLPASVGAAIYRVAQESVTNATRHAIGASRVDIEVTGKPEEICMVIVDDGKARPGNRKGSGFGLVGMTERASVLGGTFSAGPGPDRGWRVEVVLPRRGAAR